MDEVLFRVETPFGYFAILRRNNWEKHEDKREEIRGQDENVRATLERPMLVIEDATGCHHYYEIGFGSGETVGCFLHVLAQHFDEEPENERTVVSAWLTRTLKKGEVLWMRTSST